MVKNEHHAACWDSCLVMGTLNSLLRNKASDVANSKIYLISALVVEGTEPDCALMEEELKNHIQNECAKGRK